MGDHEICHYLHLRMVVVNELLEVVHPHQHGSFVVGFLHRPAAPWERVGLGSRNVTRVRTRHVQQTTTTQPHLDARGSYNSSARLREIFDPEILYIPYK